MEFRNPTLVQVGGVGPEDVVVDAKGQVYTGLDDRRLLRISPDGDEVKTVAELPGRPLGIELYGDDELLVCASDAGLLAVDLETGVLRVLVDEVAGKRLLACNNAAVAADGTIYFSDSSQEYVIPEWKKDLIHQTDTGRLLRRDPDGTVTELLGGLQFANGVALAPDESFVTVAETTTRRVNRVWLTGPKAGSHDVFVDDLPGHPDNVSTGSDGLIWVALPAPRNPAMGVVQKLPRPLRTLVLRLPEGMQPKPARTVSVIGLDADGRVVREYRGEIDGWHMLVGVRERDGKLYFGSLVESAIVVADV